MHFRPSPIPITAEWALADPGGRCSSGARRAGSRSGGSACLFVNTHPRRRRLASWISNDGTSSPEGVGLLLLVAFCVELDHFASDPFAFLVLRGPALAVPEELDSGLTDRISARIC